MAKKKGKSEKLEMIMGFERPKPKLNDKKIKAMELILSDEGCCCLSESEMKNIVDAYKAGKRGK